MANKYKLIKEYPGSRKIGYISDCCTSINSEHYLDGNWFDPALYPEYWEKIVEKDYEVLSLNFSYSNKIEKDIANLQGNGKYAIAGYMEYDEKYTGGSELNACLKSGWKIYSVKRLSDCEIFTIGDVCDGVSYERRPILEFKIVDNTLSIRQEFGHTKLSNLKKSKTPLFTTADGVDYYSDDDLVWDTHNYASNSPAIFSNPEFLCKTKVKWAKSLDRKFFSTKEAAEKYKEENKPQFSKKDLLYFIHEGRHYHPSIASSDVLKELIRLKK